MCVNIKRGGCGISLFFSFTAVSVNVYSANGVMKNHICTEKQKDIVCESILLHRDEYRQCNHWKNGPPALFHKQKRCNENRRAYSDQRKQIGIRQRGFPNKHHNKRQGQSPVTRKCIEDKFCYLLFHSPCPFPVFHLRKAISATNCAVVAQSGQINASHMYVQSPQPPILEIGSAKTIRIKY